MVTTDLSHDPDSTESPFECRITSLDYWRTSLTSPLVVYNNAKKSLSVPKSLTLQGIPYHAFTTLQYVSEGPASSRASFTAADTGMHEHQMTAYLKHSSPGRDQAHQTNKNSQMPSGISYLASSISPSTMSSPPTQPEQVTSYLQGHDSATLESHRSRTASRIASYLLPYLNPNSKILDLGCGPGTITCDFAGFCPKGTITGIDYSPSVIRTAQNEAEKRGLKNVRFEIGTAESLKFEGESFDVVHCNAVLVHIPDAVKVLKEMRRVCKNGGLVACREPDWDMCTIHPQDLRLEQWLDCHRTLKRREGIEANAGRHLAEWAIAAGFEEKKVRVSCDALQYAGQEQVKWWGELEAKRMRTERAVRAVRSGVVTEEDVEGMEKAFLEWSVKPGAIWVLMHMRLLATK